MSGKQAIPFHGIVAFGNTKDEAINRYRLLARGKGVTAMVDEGQQMAFVTHASNKIAEMFNPQSGELDLQKDETLLSNMNFEAKAGDDEVIANHYVCQSGCGLHIVYDSDDLVKHCPACTTSVTASDDEDDEEESDEDTDDEDDEDEESESADDEEEDDESDDDEEDDSEDDEEEDDSEDDEEDDEEESDEDDEESDEDDEEDDSEEDDAEDDEDDSGEPLVIAADSKEKAIEIYQLNRKGVATAATTVEVDYMVCSSSECNAHVLSEDPKLTACPACTSELKQPVEATDGAAQENPETAAPQNAGAAPVENGGAAADTSSQSSDDEEEDDDENDMNVVDEDEDDEDEESEDESESSGDIRPVKAAPAAVAAPAKEATAMSETAEKITVDMLAQVDDTGEKAHEGLDLSYSGNIAGKPLWTAFFNGTPVATASKDTVGKNADIFDHPSFGNAVIAGAKHVGLKVTLSEMGFKGIAHEISISNVVSDKVKSEVTAAENELSRDRKEHAERLMAALATSAIGINRGFFPDLKNPVKEALWNAMSSAGVKNAEVLIDNAFKGSSDAYHTSLFAKAADILNQPLEVQESLSKAVLGSNYMAVSESSSSGSNLENRLENFGSVTASAAPAAKPNAPVQEQNESVSGDARVSSVVSGLGRRR